MIHKIAHLNAHQSSVYRILVSEKNPKEILSAGGEGWVIRWNLSQPDIAHLLYEVEGSIFSMAYADNEKYLLIGNMTGGLYWIDTLQRTVLLKTQAHSKGIFDIVEHQNQLFTLGGEGRLSRWDISTKRVIESLDITNKSLRSAALSKNKMAIAASDHAIYIIDTNTFELIKYLPQAHDNSVFALKYSPDEKYLFSGGRDAQLKIWDAHQHTLLKTIPAHWFAINSIVFSPDGNLFATGSRDKTIRVWETASFQLLKTIHTQMGGHTHSVNHLVWTPEGLISASDDKTLILWELS